MAGMYGKGSTKKMSTKKGSSLIKSPATTSIGGKK